MEHRCIAGLSPGANYTYQVSALASDGSVSSDSVLPRAHRLRSALSP
jgi:hypothetical protein